MIVSQSNGCGYKIMYALYQYRVHGRTCTCTDVPSIDVEFQAITFSSYGGFGSSAHALINKMTAEAHPYDFDPWARPGPKSHAYLQLGFALARANARMLINADASRRSAHSRVRTSRLRSPT